LLLILDGGDDADVAQLRLDLLPVLPDSRSERQLDAVTGGLAGAVYGIEAVPTRWTEPLHVPLPGHGQRVLRLPELLNLAHCLAA
jgi:hypothetical protein